MRPSHEFVVKDANVNLRTQFLRIIKRAGLLAPALSQFAGEPTNRTY